MRRIAIVPVLFLSALLALARAGDRPAAEVVQSAPVETDLAEPGVRFAKDVWVEEIDAARRTIDTAQFYFASAPGRALEPVLAALERAAARGVRVRVLVCNKLLKDDEKTFARLKALPGAVVRVLDLGALTGGILHAKYWVFDGEEAYVGSQNFDWRSLSEIHEIGLRLRDARVAADLERIFDADWTVAETGALPASPVAPSATATVTATAGPSAGAPFELVASPPALAVPGVRPALAALVELIGEAKESVRVQVLEYVTSSRRDGEWPPIDDALRAAARRGVRVQLLVSDWSTERAISAGLRGLSGLENVEVKVITVPLAKEGFIPYARVCHSKYMVVDDRVLWVGTSNWSKSYFTASRNVEVIARDAGLAGQAGRVFARLWGSALAERFDPRKEYPKPRKGE